VKTIEFLIFNTTIAALFMLLVAMFLWSFQMPYLKFWAKAILLFIESMIILGILLAWFRVAGIIKMNGDQ